VVYRRPPTSCAHRLRKPDRTCGHLALSVAWRARGSGVHPQLRKRLPGQARRHCRRFRTTAIGRARAPSIGSTRALQPQRARQRALFTCICLTPHPVARREPWSASSKADGSLRATSRSRAPFCRRRHRDRVMLRERCVSPTSATDFRCEHPTDRSIPGRAPRAIRRSRADRS
jgi:hypothetical protein